MAKPRAKRIIAYSIKDHLSCVIPEDTKRKCSMLWRSNQRRRRDCYNLLEWPPKIMGFIHSRNVFQKEVDYLQQTPERVHTRRSSTHNKRREDGSSWISGSHDSKKISQAMRNMKESTHEETLIHPSIWMRNDEDEGSRRSLPTKQIKISIQLSFHDIVWLCICLMCYTCLSICIYTIELHMMGKKSMMLYNIPLLLI